MNVYPPDCGSRKLYLSHGALLISFASSSPLSSLLVRDAEISTGFPSVTSCFLKLNKDTFLAIIKYSEHYCYYQHELHLGANLLRDLWRKMTAPSVLKSNRRQAQNSALKLGLKTVTHVDSAALCKHTLTPLWGCWPRCCFSLGMNAPPSTQWDQRAWAPVQQIKMNFVRFSRIRHTAKRHRGEETRTRWLNTITNTVYVKQHLWQWAARHTAVSFMKQHD